MARENWRVVGCEGKGPSMIERIKKIIGIVAGIESVPRSSCGRNGAAAYIQSIDYGPSLPSLALDTGRPGGVQVPTRGRPVETRKNILQNSCPAIRPAHILRSAKRSSVESKISYRIKTRCQVSV